MEKFTRQSLANSVAERYLLQYKRLIETDPTWFNHARQCPKDVHAALVALGPTPDPDEVDKVIGGPSWTQPTCDACKEPTSEGVYFDTWGDDSTTIGRCCLEKALALLKEPPCSSEST